MAASLHPISPAPYIAADARIGTRLSAIRAAAAEVKRVLLRLLARLGVDHDLAYRYPAIVAGVGALAVVVILGRWVRVGCARLLCGHEAIPSWSGSREAATSSGPFFVNNRIISYLVWKIKPNSV